MKAVRAVKFVVLVVAMMFLTRTTVWAAPQPPPHLNCPGGSAGGSCCYDGTQTNFWCDANDMPSCFPINTCTVGGCVCVPINTPTPTPTATIAPTPTPSCSHNGALCCGSAASGYTCINGYLTSFSGGICTCQSGALDTPTPTLLPPAAPAGVNQAFCGGVPVSVNTALGCVPVDPAAFVVWILPFLFGISGGISFLLMVYGFFLVATSKGDPKAVAAGQETITSAIIGLLVSVFSLFILRLVAVNILVIPGLT